MNSSRRSGDGMSKTIRISLNGEARDLDEGLDLLALVRSLGLDPERVAVELDRRIVKRADWPATTLREGSEVEVVQFVGGG